MTQASRLRDVLRTNAGSPLSKRLSINFNSDMRHATVKLDDILLYAKLVDLPCILETLKTLDKKNFYKTNNVSQMLICKPEPEPEKDTEKLAVKKLEKIHQFAHGITPPLKNVRKKRYRKTLKKKYMDAPELEKELKSLLRRDMEAVDVKFEMIGENSGREVSASNAGATEPTSSTSKPFPGGVSSSDEEGEQMARQLMATSNNEEQGDTKQPKSSHEMLLMESELDAMVKKRIALQNQLKSVDNDALKARLQADLDEIIIAECEKREQLENMKEEMEA